MNVIFVRGRRVRPGLGRVLPVVAMGALLCLASYVLEVGFELAGVPPETTLLDNVILGILAAILLARYLRGREEAARLAAAKARIEMVGELNRRIRGPLTAMSRSILVENREERLRCADEALEQIDHVLNLSLPALGAATASRSLTLQ